MATSPHEVAASLAWQSDRYEHKIAVSPSFAYYSRASGRTPFASAQGKISLIYDAQVATLWKFKTRLLYKERFLTRKADPYAKYASAWASQRLDLRQDLRWDNGVWRFGGRFDIVAGDYLFRGSATPSDLPLSLLCGVEGAWKHPSPAISLHFQSAVFAIDRWDERIWYYCNDAPSNFNVLQMYGRGYYLGLYAKATFLSSLTIYLRADFTAYPWARSDDTRRLSSLSGRVQLCYFF